MHWWCVLARWACQWVDHFLPHTWHCPWHYLWHPSQATLLRYVLIPKFLGSKNRVQWFPKLQPNQFLQRSTRQSTWQASINFRLQHISVCGTFPRLPTHINQQASECWHQAAFSSDAVTTSSFFDATYAVFSQIRQPHAVRVRLGSLHIAPSHSGSLRVPMSSAWHVFPHWINNAGSHNSR